MNNKILFIAIFLINFCWIKSQNNDISSQTNIIKSPEVAAFEQYGEIPVSEYTGIPQISIPIYTLRSGDIEFPITLDYLATAIRVDQEATWVGLNWLLNAGGVISTKIAGYYPGNVPQKDWEQLYYGDLGLRTMGYRPDIEQTYKWGQNGLNLFVNCGFREASDNDITHQLYKEILRYQNGEAQLFSANFMGKSIKFIYHRLKDKFIVVGKDQKVEVSGGPGYISNIRDEQGISYAFNETEINVYTASPIQPYEGRAKSFYLTRITSPQGRFIALRYKKYEINGITPGIYPLPKVTQRGYKNFPRKGNTIETKFTESMGINNALLYEIESDDALVRFNVGDRVDLRGGKKLESIEIYEKATNRKIKTILFKYEYFGKNTTGGNLVYDWFARSNHLQNYSSLYGDEVFYKRLKLVSIQEFVTNAQNITVKKPPFVFSYYSPDLPAKSSAAIDYWGYYNGQENKTPIPSIDKQIAHTIIPSFDSGINDFSNPQASYSRANRRFNPSTVQACMLQRIRYPTGSSATFTYEPHEFGNYQYPCINTSVHDIREQVHFSDINESYPEERHSLKVFRLAKAAPADITVIFHKSSTLSWKKFTGAVAMLFSYHDRINPDGSHTEYSTPLRQWTLSQADTVGKLYDIHLNERLYLPAGKYYIMASHVVPQTDPKNPDFRGETFSEINISTTSGQDIPQYKGAGVRIKQIAHSEGSVINYEYLLANGNSSGILMEPLVFGRENNIWWQNDISNKSAPLSLLAMLPIG